MRFTLASVGVLFSLGETLFAAAPELLTAADPGAVPRFGAGGSFAPAFSADGRKLLFLSAAANLTTNSSLNGSVNLFEIDLASEQVRLISSDPAGALTANGSCGVFQSSLDGKIVFESLASNLAGRDTNQTWDVFLKTETGAALVSVATNGLNSGARSSFHPSISANGNVIAFQTFANNLVPVDANRFQHLMIYQVTNGAMTVVPPTAVSLSDSHLPPSALSADGQRAIYTVVVPSPLRSEVYAYDLAMRTNLWVSKDALAQLRTVFPTTFQAFSEKPVLSADGRFALFSARGNVIGRAPMVLYHDLQTGFTRLVSSNGHPVALSMDGQTALFFQSSNYSLPLIGTNLVRWSAKTVSSVSLAQFVVSLDRTFNPVMGSIAATADLQSIAFVNLNTRFGGTSTEVLLLDGTNLFEVTMAPFADAAADVVISPDGTRVAFAGEGHIFLWDKQTGQTRWVTAPRSSSSSSGHARITGSCVSDDGRLVVFEAHDGDLISGDTNRFPDIFLKDSVKGLISLISRKYDQSGQANGSSGSACVSGDGRFVAFVSWATNLVQFDRNGFGDIFLYDRENDTVTLASKSPGGAAASASSWAPALSTDGRYLFFLSNATNLSATADTDNRPDLFRYEIANGTNQLISASTASLKTSSAELTSRSGDWAIYYAEDGQKGLHVWTPAQTYFNTNIMFFPAAFAPGSAELFATAVTRYGKPQLQLWDLLPNAVSSVCINCYDPEITPDGRFLAYSETTTRGQTVYRAIHVMNRQTQERKTFGATNAFSSGPKLSQDGRKLFFVRHTYTNIEPHLLRKELYLADVASGETVLLTPSIRAVPPDTRFTQRFAITPDGQTIVFQSFAPDLVPGDLDEASDIFVLRLGSATDSDSDGLEDSWEVTYFGDLSQDGGGDADVDGASNRAEFEAGTNPTSERSIFKVVKLENVTGGLLTLLWSAIENRTYQVQYKDSVNDPWSNLGAAVQVGASTGSVEDPAGKPQRFYRVLLIR